VARRGTAIQRGGQLMRTLRLVGVHLRIAALNEMQYRVNFLLSLLQSLIALGTGLIVLSLVFRRVGELNGWSRPELLVVLGVFTAIGGVVRSVIKPNIAQFIEDVRAGTLDYLLVKPADGQLLVGIRAVQLWQSIDVLVGAILVGVGLRQLPGGISISVAGLFLATLLLGVAMVYSLLMALGISAFWFVQSTQILEFFDGVWQAGRWPVSIYPRWLRIGLTLVVPVAFSVTVPAEVLTSRATGTTLAGMLGLSVALFGLTRWYWRFGLRHYTGASA
jgi:ABC-2 type transport system permease protein